MPQKMLCKECGEVLYVGLLLKSPQEIIKKFEGKCPICEKELVFDAESIKVKPTKN